MKCSKSYFPWINVLQRHLEHKMLQKLFSSCLQAPRKIWNWLFFSNLVWRINFLLGIIWHYRYINFVWNKICDYVHQRQHIFTYTPSNDLCNAISPLTLYHRQDIFASWLSTARRLEAAKIAVLRPSSSNEVRARAHEKGTMREDDPRPCNRREKTLFSQATINMLPNIQARRARIHRYHPHSARWPICETRIATHFLHPIITTLYELRGPRRGPSPL